MPVRDVVLTLILVALVPAIIARPYFGPLAWAWVSMMVPHRLTWGFAYSLPFAYVTAGATVFALLIARDKKMPPSGSITTFLALLYVWMCVTSLFALNPGEDVYDMWLKVTKIQFMLWITMMLLIGRRQIELLVWTIVISLGFYGVKGGFFTVRTGGGERVWGPPGSFIEGNNELALALVVVMPLMFYLRTQATAKWSRMLWLVAMVLCMFSVLGSHSRGAFLAVLAMMLFLGMKSHRPLLYTVLNFVLLGLIALAMPENWTERMETITSHEDQSAQSRLYTWRMIWNLVTSRPLGAGFEFWTPEVWARYAVDEWARPYSPHSIYFQVLGEHGFVGLFLYVGLGVVTWRVASRMIRMSGKDPGTQWLRTLLRCIQVSLVSFAVGGAFLNLVNFDVPYYLAAIVALLWRDCRPVPVPAGRGRAAGSVAAPTPEPVTARVSGRGGGGG